MFKNNNFPRDDHFEHLTRVEDCASGLDTYSGELGILASLVTEVQEYAENYAGVLEARQTEEDDWHAAVVEYETVRDELMDAVSDARWMVKSILESDEFSESTKNLLRNNFELDGDVSYKYETLRNQGKAVLRGQEKLIELDSEWELPAGLITRIEDDLEAFIAARDSVKTEKIEKQNAVDVLYEMRVNGHRLLRKVYRWAIAVWGDDDEKLFALGFVPKSAIWTPGQPEPGTPVHPEAASFDANYLGQEIVELVYGPEVDAVSATIRRAKSGAANYVIIAQGLPMDENRVPYRDTDVPPGESVFLLRPKMVLSNPEIQLRHRVYPVMG